MENIYMVHYNEKDLECYKKYGFKCINSLINDVHMNFEETDILYYVSPANSYLSMNGGIDYQFEKMFLIEKVLKSKTNFLEIGKSILTKINEKTFLISSPTMEIPEQIIGTNNVYLAAKSTFEIWPRDGKLLLVPMGCGVGKMSFEESCRQILEAYRDVFKKD
jgi:O-acetyl-ADP-ribose deacetylase (regulator of RNase III)